MDGGMEGGIETDLLLESRLPKAGWTEKDEGKLNLPNWTQFQLLTSFS